MTEELGLGYYGIKGMKYGAVPPMPKVELPPIIPEKLSMYRWQFDAFIEIMVDRNRIPFETLWAYANAHFDIIKLPQKGLGDIPNVYIFFGYKQDATRYRLEHDIAPKDMVIARDWGLLEGRRARPILIGQDSEWSKLNWNHEHSRKTRQMVHMLESYYGTAT